MNVSAIIVTRGDVPLDAIIATIPEDWQLVVWDNGKGSCWIYDFDHGMRIPWMKEPADDLAVYGRYAAIEHARGDLIYVQDDDVIVSEPEAIVQAWREYQYMQYDFSHPDYKVPAEWANDHVVANMPQPFRHDFYSDHCLVGFGAVFHRDAPQRAFERLNVGMTWKGVCPPHWSGLVLFDTLNFRRTCDVVFTALTPRVLVDVPYENLPWATDESRMYRQNGHVGERTRMLELVRAVRDAG